MDSNIDQAITLLRLGSPDKYSLSEIKALELYINLLSNSISIIIGIIPKHREVGCDSSAVLISFRLGTLRGSSLTAR